MLLPPLLRHLDLTLTEPRRTDAENCFVFDAIRSIRSTLLRARLSCLKCLLITVGLSHSAEDTVNSCTQCTRAPQLYSDLVADFPPAFSPTVCLSVRHPNSNAVLVRRPSDDVYCRSVALYTSPPSRAAAAIVPSAQLDSVSAAGGRLTHSCSKLEVISGAPCPALPCRPPLSRSVDRLDCSSTHIFQRTTQPFEFKRYGFHKTTCSPRMQLFCAK